MWGNKILCSEFYIKRIVIVGQIDFFGMEYIVIYHMITSRLGHFVDSFIMQIEAGNSYIALKLLGFDVIRVKKDNTVGSSKQNFSVGRYAIGIT